MMDHGPLPRCKSAGKLEFQLRKRTECVGPVCGMELMLCVVYIVEMRLVIVAGAF